MMILQLLAVPLLCTSGMRRPGMKKSEEKSSEAGGLCQAMFGDVVQFEGKAKKDATSLVCQYMDFGGGFRETVKNNPEFQLICDTPGWVTGAKVENAMCPQLNGQYKRHEPFSDDWKRLRRTRQIDHLPIEKQCLWPKVHQNQVPIFEQYLDVESLEKGEHPAIIFLAKGNNYYGPHGRRYKIYKYLPKEYDNVGTAQSPGRRVGSISYETVERFGHDEYKGCRITNVAESLRKTTLQNLPKDNIDRSVKITFYEAMPKTEFKEKGYMEDSPASRYAQRVAAEKLAAKKQEK